MGRIDWEARSTFDRFYSKLSGLRDGGLAGAEAKDETLSFWGVEFHSRAIVGSARIGLVVDLWRRSYLCSFSLSILDSLLRHVNAIQASLNDWLEGGRRRPVYCIWKLYKTAGWAGRPEEPSEASIPSYAVVVSAVVLLSLVYQYLTGNVDTGSSKAYSRSSLDFRDIYVAVVLFLGAYVWIKFREVAHHRGVRRRVVKSGRITKVVYDARLTPRNWNGEAVPKLELGQFATEQEAHNKFRIAAFYYNRDAGLLDGWFQVPPMSEDERSLTGLALRAWVIGQAKRVYEDFKLLQELLEGEVNVDFSIPSLLNPDEHQQPARVSQTENLGMAMAMVDEQGLECPPHSFNEVHEDPALPNGHSLGFQQGSARPVPQLPSNTESGMSLNVGDQSDSLQTVVSTQQQQIHLQQQQISDQQRQIQELGAQMLQFQNQQRIQEQHLRESRIQYPQGSYQLYLQEQLVQVVNPEGVPGVEMEQSLH